LRGRDAPCPGRGAARQRCGAEPGPSQARSNHRLRNGPGSAAHHKSAALHPGHDFSPLPLPVGEREHIAHARPLRSFRTDRAKRGLIRNLAGLEKIPGSPLTRRPGMTASCVGRPCGDDGSRPALRPGHDLSTRHCERSDGRLQRDTIPIVMAGLDPAIHALAKAEKVRRGCAGQARP
jgi:hypothetical protein